jgi:murein DD-endopeptidase MepM/ murein hydrolase activator NlpD
VARHRFIASALLAVFVVTSRGWPAAAETRVGHALHQRHETVERAQALRRQHVRLESHLRHRIEMLQRRSENRFVTGLHVHDERRDSTIEATARMIAITRSRIRALDPRTRAKLRALHAHYDDLQRWLDVQGIFRACPVPEFTDIADNFGVIVRIPHVPVHVHQGNDVAAPTGSPILAPFDGLASAGHDKLGGFTVHVYGSEGYVYNAHLSSFGQLGWVDAGDVIGYVGSTGDAQGPHDHVEWHPNDGPAVDPHEYLLAACEPVTSP